MQLYQGIIHISVRISSAAVVTGAALNVVLDPVFMFDWGLGMGVEGDSLATTVSQFVTCFILEWFYISGRSIIKIKREYFRPKWELVKTVTLIGIPTAVIQICLAVATSLTNIAAKPMADADLIIAAYGVVQRLVLIGCYVVMGFMQGYQPVASYSFGANKEERFHESVRFALRTSLILTVLVTGIYILMARPLIMLFNGNPAVIDYGVRLLISQVALYPAFGLCYNHEPVVFWTCESHVHKKPEGGLVLPHAVSCIDFGRKPEHGRNRVVHPGLHAGAFNHSQCAGPF